ncbi:MAG: winged helix-turn-helix transcriptional regulator [Candidatus Heimdallarchaeota archaeon]|nr:winged helix-turn-helix transcriptional regulator [Candidatus Heimdallarchaeota archaeon]
MLRYLQDNSPKTQREIMESLDLPTRTVRYSLRRLLERDLIIRIANLNDMRSVYYQINPQIVDLNQVIVQELSIIET